MVYGYARVSSRGQAISGFGLEVQEEKLLQAGAIEIYKDVYRGTTIDRPEWKKLASKVQSGDTIIICKLDRLARNAEDAIHIVKSFVDNGVTINVLNMGLANNTPMGKLMLSVMAGFAEFERDVIVERLAEGKQIAKQNVAYKEGRPKKYSEKKIDSAMELLKTHSLKQVEEITGISKSTISREKAKRKLLGSGTIIE